MSIIASASSSDLSPGTEYEHQSENSGVVTSAKATLINSITIDGAYVYTEVIFTGTWVPPGSTSPVGFTATITGNTTYTSGDGNPLVTVDQSVSGGWGVITIKSPRNSTMEV